MLVWYVQITYPTGSSQKGTPRGPGTKVTKPWFPNLLSASLSAPLSPGAFAERFGMGCPPDLEPSSLWGPGLKEQLRRRLQPGVLVPQPAFGQQAQTKLLGLREIS